MNKHPACNILFLTKLFEESTSHVLIDVIDLVHNKLPSITYFFLRQDDAKLISNRYPSLATKVYDPQSTAMIDYVITIGGDGTILNASSLFQGLRTPRILSIQKGTLGFMCKFEVEDLP